MRSDIILVRMTSDVIRKPEQRYNYSNAITGLISLLREDGVKGLARGLGTNAVSTARFDVLDGTDRVFVGKRRVRFS